MDLLSFTCPECVEYQSDSLNSLRIHCQKRHRLSSIDLYKKLFLNGQEPTCECGCGQIPRFHSLQVGYMKFIRGHASRVHNNWGHNEEARSKSLKKRRDEGLWSKDPWNRGKTKENDPEFEKIAEKAYGTKEFKENRSRYMTQQWKDCNLYPLTGSAHSQWRGGTSALQPLVRAHLHRAWTYPKLKATGFKCSKCGATKELEVHHDGERFASILHRAILELGAPGDDFEKKSLISEWVTDYHIKQNISGVVLCEDCHVVEHSKDHS